MQTYTQKITLIENSRGVWDLDPFKGCEDGMKNNPKGCYGLCYAAKIAKFRGYDFSKTVYRYFNDENKFKEIIIKISQTSFLHGLQPPFIRMGVMCDPSYDWDHTLYVISKIKAYIPNIVIITKHWRELKGYQLKYIKKIKNIFINTSVSALDTKKQIKCRLYWYNKLKKYCHSILRVNTADFNDIRLKKVQEKLLNNVNVIDNILRINKNHYLVKNNIVNVKKHKFISSEVWASKYNNNTYFGKCGNCPDQCGVNLRNRGSFEQSLAW